MEEVIGGKQFAAGKVQLGQCILEKVKKNKLEEIQKKREAEGKEQAKYVEAVKEAEIVKRKMAYQNKQLKDLTNKELKAVMKPLKRDGDTALPTRKEQMIEWIVARNGLTYPEAAAIELEVGAKEEGNDGGNCSEGNNEDDALFMEQTI